MIKMEQLDYLVCLMYWKDIYTSFREFGDESQKIKQIKI